MMACLFHILIPRQPFLITLGLPESLTALVWAVAPLCGVLVQPYVGVMSDRCQNPWGRRRPFILSGAIGCVVCMLGLASTRPMSQILARVLELDIHKSSFQTWVLLLAITWLLALNICIQPLQAGIRALIVDNCSASQQARASAWSSRITGIGNIIGYSFGFIPVGSILPFFDISQFTWLCIVASVILSSTVGITCAWIQEKDPRSLPAAIGEGQSFGETVRHIIWSARTMPSSISQVCKVQFFAWLGWFPYLFYISR
jgi:solute carrier family 45, member 1/2/4